MGGPGPAIIGAALGLVRTEGGGVARAPPSLNVRLGQGVGGACLTGAPPVAMATRRTAFIGASPTEAVLEGATPT